MITSNLQLCAARVIPEKANIPVALLHNYNLGTIMGDSNMKRCCICKKEKEVSKFSKNRSRKDGLCSKCKHCDNILSRIYHRTEKGRENRRLYCQTEKQKQAHRLSSKQYSQKNKSKRLAQQAVYRAIQAGKLSRPDTLQCLCGNHKAEQYHHHKGYAREHWLDIVPVCIDCHCELHY